MLVENLFPRKLVCPKRTRFANGSYGFALRNPKVVGSKQMPDLMELVHPALMGFLPPLLNEVGLKPTKLIWLRSAN